MVHGRQIDSVLFEISGRGAKKSKGGEYPSHLKTPPAYRYRDVFITCIVETMSSMSQTCSVMMP